MSPRPHRVWQSSNIPKPVNRGKGKVVKIDFGDKEEEILRVFKGLPPNKLVEKWIIRTK